MVYFRIVDYFSSCQHIYTLDDTQAGSVHFGPTTHTLVYYTGTIDGYRTTSANGELAR